MRIYVFTGVLTDYTEGMAVVIAKTREEANALMARDTAYSYDYWAKSYAHSFPLADSVELEGLVAYVHGGS